jgi:repressor LexA
LPTLARAGSGQPASRVAGETVTSAGTQVAQTEGDEVMAQSAASATSADPGSADRTDAAAGQTGLIDRLAHRRARAGLSQAALARLVGTSQSAVARLESGRHDVQLSTLIRYTRALGLRLDLVEDAAQAGETGEESLGTPLGPGTREPLSHGASPSLAAGPPDRPHPGHILTWRQRKVLQAIRDSVQRRGYPPSLREIAAATGLSSVSSVSYQLAALQSKGYLRRDVGQARTVEIRLPGQPAVRPEGQAAAATITGIPAQETAYVPLVGQIAAGRPVLAEQAIVDFLPLPRQLVGEGTLFLLEVAGDAMSTAGIRDGDWAVVREQPHLDDGDVVAAMVDGAATVAALRRASGSAWLVPANPAYRPVPGDEATMLGRVVALLRRF